MMISRTNLGRLIKIFVQEEKLKGGGQEAEIFQLRVMLLFLYLAALIVCLFPTEPKKPITRTEKLSILFFPSELKKSCIFI